MGEYGQLVVNNYSLLDNNSSLFYLLHVTHIVLIYLNIFFTHILYLIESPQTGDTLLGRN